MSWAKLSDDYGDDCWTLSDAAFRLHTEALVWNGRKLLDCRIPKDDVRRFARHPDAARELLDVGWWSDDADAYVLRHHAAYQRTREAVVNQQEANTKNGAKGGRPKAPREQASGIEPKTSETQSVSESPNGSETERDRTGQDRSAVMGEREVRDREAEFFDLSRSRCSVCSGPLTSPLDRAEGVCVACDNQAHRAQAS
jgi:hypothetical protein